MSPPRPRAFEGVLRCQPTGRAHRVRPVKFHVRPIAESNLLFEQAHHLARLALPHQTGPLSLIEAVENFNPVPWCPHDLGFRPPIEQGNGCRVMRVAPTFVSEPPRGVGVTPHFLSDRRNAAPSNFGAFGSPTARFSASCRVIRGRRLLGVRRLGWRCAVDIVVLIPKSCCLLLRPRQDARRTGGMGRHYANGAPDPDR